MNECYLKNCFYDSKDGPFCRMDVCLMSEAELQRLEHEKEEADLAQLYREELYDDSDQ